MQLMMTPTQVPGPVLILRRLLVPQVAHTLHVSPNTWACIILFLSIVLYAPVIVVMSTC